MAMGGDSLTVVGIDGSPASLRALRWAVRDAERHRSTLRLVTAVEIPQPPYFGGVLSQNILDAVDDEGQRKLAEARQVAANVSSDVEISETLVHGPATPALLETGRQARRVVVGTRGLGDLTGLPVGSTAQAVVAHAPCPVAVLRAPDHDPEPPDTGPVIVGIDGSPVSEAALAAAFDEASLRQAPLVAFHAWSDTAVDHWFARDNGPDWDAIEQHEHAVLAERLAGWQEHHPAVSVQRLVVRDRPVRYLVQEGAHAQLIVVGSHGRGGFQGMLLGSTSHALLHTTPCPLLVVRPHTDHSARGSPS
jgi:nucleotide-binding universal stress UspA family protein